MALSKFVQCHARFPNYSWRLEEVATKKFLEEFFFQRNLKYKGITFGGKFVHFRATNYFDKILLLAWTPSTATMKSISCNLILQRNIFRSLFTGFLEIPKLNIKSWSIVFFGSDNFSLVSLKALNSLKKEKAISTLEVVTNEQNPVYKYSVSNNLTVHSWLPHLNGSYDFGVIVSFGKLIPKCIIDKFPLGIINVHGSLLPKYRGGMPIVHAVKNGDTSTGITISRIKPDKFDIGEIILQKPCAIAKNELLPSLYIKLANLGCECLLEVISNMPECLKNSFPQAEQEASYAPILKKEMAVVRWNDMTALEVYNLYRALFGMFELSSKYKGQQVKFVCLHLNDDDLNSFITNESKKEPGSIIFNKEKKFLYVQCKDKAITVCTVKVKHKMMDAGSFYNGYLQNSPRTSWKFDN